MPYVSGGGQVGGVRRRAGENAGASRHAAGVLLSMPSERCRKTGTAC